MVRFYFSKYTRLIFNSPLRRLQDKTQVFPLDTNDFVHTRLTHSLEVSTIARSIGNGVAKMLSEVKDRIPNELSNRLGPILAAAGLVHDIGNPPFEHYGETVIQNFFKKKTQRIILFRR